LRAQVKTLTDLVLSRNDNKKPAPPQFDKKIECFHCKGLAHTGKRKLTGGNVTSNTKLRNDVWQCNHYQNISSSK
jgi:hypothetical protein